MNAGLQNTFDQLNINPLKPQKRRLTIKDIDEYTVGLANCLMAKKETKEKARDTMLKMIARSCVSYENDPQFKAEMDAAIKLLNL